MCGQIEPDLPELNHKQWPEVKSRCKEAGIKDYLTNSEDRDWFYRTVAPKLKTPEEVRRALERITS